MHANPIVLRSTTTRKERIPVYGVILDAFYDLIA